MWLPFLMTQQQLIDLGIQHKKEGLEPTMPNNKWYMRGYKAETVFPGLGDFREEEWIERWDYLQDESYYDFFCSS